MTRLLVSARDYLAHEFMCHDDKDLLRVLDLESDYVEGILNYNWWVKLDAKEVCPVDVYMRDEMGSASRLRGGDVGLPEARLRRHGGPPLRSARAALGASHATTNQIQKQACYLPLEKLYLHPHQSRGIYEDLGDLLGMIIDRAGRIISKRTAERARAAHNREFILWGPGSQRCGEICNVVLGGRCITANQPELILWDQPRKT